MKDAYLTLRLNLSLDAPEGAGWYVYAIGDEQALLKPRRVGGVAAMELGEAFDQVATDSDDLKPTAIVGSGNILITQTLQQQIEYAEGQARRIAQLRRTLAEETDTMQATPPKETNV